MRLLLVFLKEPAPGKVKTRLAADVGEETATRYYRALVEVLLKQLRGLQKTRIRFCYAPDDAHDAIRFWLLPEMNASSKSKNDNSVPLFHAPATQTSTTATQEIDFHPQGDGNLGDRMSRAFTRGFEEGFQEIAVIGTDCPECGSRWINAAFARMHTKPNNHGVIGPCPDGGYYLLGLQSPAPSLFNDIPWSQSDVLAATLTAAKNSQLSLEQLPPLNDIDHLDDWLRLMDSPLGAAIKKSLGEEDPTYH